MYDMLKKTFGVLMVERRAEKRAEHHGQAAWVCKCVCGNEHVVTGRELRTGHTKSCGCKKAEMTSKAKTRHGQASNGKMGLEYRIWIEMKQRCTNPNSNRYYTHGARGIKVCDRWRESYENFIADMGERPGKGLSLERRDNDGDYEPSNCFWATKKQQARNKRSNRVLTVGVSARCVSEWSEITGIPAGTILGRLKRGWTPDAAVGRT